MTLNPGPPPVFVIVLATTGALLVVASAGLDLSGVGSAGVGTFQIAGIAVGLALILAADGLARRPAGPPARYDIPWVLGVVSIVLGAGAIALASQSTSSPESPSGSSASPLDERVLALERSTRPARRLDGRCLPSSDRAVPALALEPVVSGLEKPVYTSVAPTGGGRLFIVERDGTIRIADGGRMLDPPFLDLRDRVVSDAGEQGLFSVAFPPDFSTSGRFYVHYSAAPDGQGTVSRFRVSDDQNRADLASEEVLLSIPTVGLIHFGGQLQFGPDGYLYASVGDGAGSRIPSGDSTVYGDGAVFYGEDGTLAIPPGSGFTRHDLDRVDPWNQGQSLRSLRGKILRIDVSTDSSYSIPPDNPFVADADDGARGEIWAYGFRNPWRFSFDSCGDALFVADVGDKRYEEINLVEKGGNYGWKRMEGGHCQPHGQRCDTAGLEFPIAEYGHLDIDPAGGSAVIGGYVYRGERIPPLVGRYLFADFVSSRLWALTPTARTASGWQMEELIDLGIHPTSFGLDAEGELLIVDYGGTIYRLVPAT